ncbi:glycosyltransferase family 4 protein [Aliagarivorans marinus]|uniref:glycosyltransferase family 4 protein n=1 Tax=Aliagarivorans marinus TaxID=561965 RepID=UPI000404EB4E|nr:glycosyltransferase family 4 protein [Aliagarivorans marinus]
MKCGSKFFSSRSSSGVAVLSITNVFPSLIQPWFVNQLIQVVEFGGENRILAMDGSHQQYSDDIDKFALLPCSACIPWLSMRELWQILLFLLNPAHWPRMLRGWRRQAQYLGEYPSQLGHPLNRLLLSAFCAMDNFDLIHSHSEIAAWRFLPIIACSGKPLVITFHGLPPKGVQPLSMEQREILARHASTILVNTEFAKRHYVAIGGDPDKVKIIPQGLKLSDFPYQPLPVPKPGETIHLLTVGRFHPDKGQHYALEAVKQLVEQGHNIHYTLVGNGPEKTKLTAQAEELGLAERVTLLSGLSDEDLRGQYRRAHVFILPSLRDREGFHEETQGVVMQEAQASGVLVVATKTGGIPECFDDGESGFLVEDRSSQQLASKLHYLITNSESWPSWREAGLANVQQYFDMQVIGGRLQQVYREVLASSKEEGHHAS